MGAATDAATGDRSLWQIFRQRDLSPVVGGAVDGKWANVPLSHVLT